MDEKYGNIGRFITVKRGFGKHLMAAIKTILPVTKNLEEFVQKPAKYRLMQAEDRMIDKVDEIITNYQKKANGGQAGLNAPLPVVIVAYAKDSVVSDVTLGRGVYAAQNITFSDENGREYTYKIKTTHMENRVQVCFIGEDSETVRAMTSQVRLYLQGYLKRIFPITWRFGGFDFDLSGVIDDTAFVDSVVDVDNRTNISVIVWDFSIRFQMPYLFAPDGSELDDSGKLAGFGNVEDVVIDINHNDSSGKRHFNKGYIDSDKQDSVNLPFGQWAVNPADIPDITKDLNTIVNNNNDGKDSSAGVGNDN